MNGKALMRERAMLIGWKYSHGLTADEATRLEFLNAEALRRYPRVTPEMVAALKTASAALTATPTATKGD